MAAHNFGFSIKVFGDSASRKIAWISDQVSMMLLFLASNAISTPYDPFTASATLNWWKYVLTSLPHSFESVLKDQFEYHALNGTYAVIATEIK